MSRTTRRRSDQRGYTLVELLVVLGIIALLAAVAAPQVLRYLGDARSDVAGAQLRNIEGALELYYLDMGEYPDQQKGLGALVTAPEGAKAWRGPYMKRLDGLTDPWGNLYVYRLPGKNGKFDLLSFGRDGKEGGEGEDFDIVNW